jgi:hypothetical protein
VDAGMRYVPDLTISGSTKDADVGCITGEVEDSTSTLRDGRRSGKCG